MARKVSTVARPYHLLAGTGRWTRFVALLTSEEAQRLLTPDAIRSASSHKVVIGQSGALYTLVPATLGGGAAFIIERG